MTFIREYGCNQVFGVHGGYPNILDRSSWEKLTENSVMDIHNYGGTILKATPGHPAPEAAARALREHGVTQVFALGGDGSHKYLTHLTKALVELEHECACVGVPATI